MKTGRKKTVFVMAALIVLAVGVMLIGNTLADGVSKNTQAEAAGSAYKVLFQYKNAQGAYAAVPADAAVNGVSAVTEGMYWCPGRTEIIYLMLDNREMFDTMATVSVDVYGAGFGDTLTYAVVHGDTPDHPGNWNDFLAAAQMKGTLKAGAAQQSAENYKLLVNQLLDNEASDNRDANNYYLAVAIHMDENASNAYQNNTMTLDLKLQIDANFKPGANPANATKADKSL